MIALSALITLVSYSDTDIYVYTLWWNGLI